MLPLGPQITLSQLSLHMQATRCPIRGGGICPDAAQQEAKRGKVGGHFLLEVLLSGLLRVRAKVL